MRGRKLVRQNRKEQTSRVHHTNSHLGHSAMDGKRKNRSLAKFRCLRWICEARHEKVHRPPSSNSPFISSSLCKKRRERVIKKIGMEKKRKSRGLFGLKQVFVYVFIYYSISNCCIIKNKPKRATVACVWK